MVFASAMFVGTWSGCLATELLINKHPATRRVVVSGGWGNQLDRQVPTSL